MAATGQSSERHQHAEATYQRLFGPRDVAPAEDDPELMEILRGFIFGDVFDTGVLDDQARELITVTVPGLSAGPAAAEVTHASRPQRRRPGRPDP